MTIPGQRGIPLLAAGKQHLIAALGNILQYKLKPASMGVIKEISIHRFLLVWI